MSAPPAGQPCANTRERRRHTHIQTYMETHVHVQGHMYTHPELHRHHRRITCTHTKTHTLFARERKKALWLLCAPNGILTHTPAKRDVCCQGPPHAHSQPPECPAGMAFQGGPLGSGACSVGAWLVVPPLPANGPSLHSLFS